MLHKNFKTGPLIAADKLGLSNFGQITFYAAAGYNGVRVLMEDSNKISEELIAPCGMNCAICSKYLSYTNNLKRSQCKVCRPGNKSCNYLFAKCSGANVAQNKNSVFCFECCQYPCKEINRMDKRYKKNYHMSVKENLDTIKNQGISEFIQEQYVQYSCSKCGGLISIHNRKCFNCSTITKLVEKLEHKK